MDKTFDSFAFGPWWSAQCRWLLTETEEYWREVRMPGADLSDLPPEVQSEINAKWTPQLLADYEAWLLDPEQPVDVPGPITPTPKQVRLVREAKAALTAKAEELEPGPKPAPKAKRK